MTIQYEGHDYVVAEPPRLQPGHELRYCQPRVTLAWDQCQTEPKPVLAVRKRWSTGKGCIVLVDCEGREYDSWADEFLYKGD